MSRFDTTLNPLTNRCEWCGDVRWKWNLKYLYNEGPFCSDRDGNVEHVIGYSQLDP